MKFDCPVLKWTKRKIERHKDRCKEWLTCVEMDKEEDRKT
jgi:hypothetical protein